MIYPYFCEKCDNEFEIIKSVRNIDDVEKCPDCGNIGERTIAKEQAFSKSSAGDWNTSHYNPAFGKWMKSNSEAKSEAKRKGLIEVGTEPPENIHKHFEKDREHRSKERWRKFNTSLGEFNS